jgi:hypothetical protein
LSEPGPELPGGFSIVRIKFEREAKRMKEEGQRRNQKDSYFFFLIPPSSFLLSPSRKGW